MKFRAIFAAILLAVALVFISHARQDDFPVLKGPYLGQKPPGKIPVKFPFNFVPEGYKLHSAPAFAPDGEEVYFSAMDFSVRYSEKIFVMKMVDGIWTPPRVAPFSGGFFDGSPSLSKDGRYLVFSSARTANGKGLNDNGERNIWYLERTGQGWSAPRPLSFQTKEWENGSDVSELGNLFFDSKDIYRIKFPPAEQDEPEGLGNAINSDHTELHPCVAPDERFIVFYSSRPGHYGTSGGDLYISFRKEDGTWSEARDLGGELNLPGGKMLATISPDNQYLFFCNGGDIYWVSLKILDELKTK